VWNLIDRALYLDVDERTLRERLARRTNNDVGKDPSELAVILGWHGATADTCRRFGIEPVDATRPIDEVVDDILRRCGAPRPGRPTPTGAPVEERRPRSSGERRIR
jgi:thymidylate kinase